MADIQPTQFAAKLIDLAALFQNECGDRHIFIGARTFVPSMTAPELSTAGGRHMVQHLRISPLEGQINPAIVFGTVRQSARTVELRSHACVIAAYGQRSKSALLELDPLTFDPALDAVQEFFERQGYHVTIVDETPIAEQKTAAPMAASKSSDSSTRLIVAAAGAVAVLSTVAWFVLR